MQQINIKIEEFNCCFYDNLYIYIEDECVAYPGEDLNFVLNKLPFTKNGIEKFKEAYLLIKDYGFNLLILNKDRINNNEELIKSSCQNIIDYVCKYNFANPAKIISNLEYIFNSYEYSDNFRFAKADDKQAILLYKLLKNKGCCGFYDEIIELEGEKYFIGFNYGH